MIKRITNRQGVSIQSTYVIQGNTTPKGIDETYLATGSNQHILMKFSGLNLSQLERIGRAVLRLVVTQDTTIMPNPTEKTAFYVHRNLSDFNPTSVVWTSKPSLASSFEAGFLVPVTQVAAGWMPEDPSQFPYTVVELDLTGIINYWKINNISFHGITISKSAPGVIINPSKTDVTGINEFFIMEESKLQGLEPLLSHTPVECGFPGTGYVNDLTGKLVFQTLSLQTSSKNAPISFTAFRHNKSIPETSKTWLLGSQYSASFEYAIIMETDFARLIQPNGSESIFTKMTKLEAERYGIFVFESEVYVDLSSYAYATNNGTSIVIRYPDNTKIELNLHKIQKVTMPSGDTITYYWNTAQDRLLYMINSDGERVNLYYNSNGKISEIDFVSEQRLLQITYDTNQTEITSITLKKWIFDPESSSGDKIYTELEKATFTKSEPYYTVVDVKNDDRTEFQLADEKVYSVVNKKHASGDILNQVQFSRELDKTVIEDFLGNKQYLYFDDYGQVKHKIDDQGKSIKAEYELVGLDGTTRRVTSKSEIQPNRSNLIVDFSFDNQIGEYKTTTKGWKKNSDTNNIVKTMDGGVFGNKCLLVRKTGSGQTRITQLINVNPGSYSFIGFEKRINISGNPVVKANITYTILRLAQGSETGILDESGNSWVSDTVTTSVSTSALTGSTNKWQKFVLPTIIIPTGATNSTIELEIYASHTSGDLLLDDFQLATGEHVVNFNLIPNGYFEENLGSLPTDWSVENLDSYDKIVDSSLDYPYHLFVGTRTMRFTGDFTKTKKLFKTFDVKGTLGDELVFSGWFRGKVLANEEAIVVVSFIDESTVTDVQTVSFQPNDSGWQNVSRGFVAKTDFTQVKVSVEYRGFNVLLFDALQLYVNSNESHYAYDDLGNIMDQSSAKATSESISNALGQTVQSSNKQGEVYRYKYDVKGQMTEVKDNKGNKVVHVYDSKGNPITMELNSSHGKVSHSKTFNTKNQLVKSTDEFGRESINLYDTEFRHIQTTDPLGHRDKKEYNEFNQLMKIIREDSQSGSESLSYQYDENRNLKKIIIDPTKYYEFFYDTKKRIEKININSSTIVQYTYNTKNQIVTQKYGSHVDSDYYTFGYDTRGRLISVSFNGEITPSCTYKYDELDRISEVRYQDVTTYNSYDRSGKLIRKTNSEGISERYIFDNIDAIQKSIIDINGVIRSFEYIMSYETSQYNFDGFINRLDRAYDDDYALIDSNYNGQTGLKCYGGSLNNIEDDSVLRTPVLVLSSSAGEARYRLSEANQRRSISRSTGQKFSYAEWKSRFDSKKTLFGWFKFSTNRIYDQPIFSVLGHNNLNQIELALQPNGQIKLRVNGQYHLISGSTFTYAGTNWVMLGLKLENSGNNIKSTVYINGSKCLEVTQNIKVLPGNTVDMKVSDFGNLVLGIYNPDAFPLVTSEFRVAHMQVGAFNYTDADITKIYSLALPYFNGTIVRKQRSGVLYHDHQAYDGLDVVTLKGTLVSHKGVHPSSLGYQAGTYKLDKTRLFEYDDSRKIHVYGSYGNDKDLISSKAKLVYDFNMKNTGMLAIRFKPVDVGTQLRTILSLQKGTETPLGLYVNSTNKLVLTQDQLETLNNTILTNAWNQLVIRWNETSLWIYLNGDTVVSRTKSLSYENAVLSVGAIISDSIPSNHFNGQFEMLAHSDQIFDDSKATLIRNSYQTIAYESEYDVLGRKEKDELSVGTTKRTAEYTYKRPNGDSTKTSFEVEHMKTLANQNIYYNYDALGNVTEMDTPEGTYEYKYDFMGRLIEEYNPVLNQTIKMEYDKQNMTFKTYYVGKTINMVKQLEFLTNAEDQLVYVGTVEGGNETPLDISYGSKYVGNPSEIGSKELKWEGRRLKQILDGDDTIDYTYNEHGLRTKKNINGVETKYYLQGTNIISEEKNGQTMHFIYNEQNQLVGFEHQQSKYFYVRDLLGVIRNIIDINGNIVVTYKYDAWGNHKVYDSSNAENTSTSFIGNINPFRYKGYYYDLETEWYYLQSRYYSPLLSRFINMDHTANLGMIDVDGVFLFAYCGNNPIDRFDYDGKSWKKFFNKTKKWIKGIANSIGELFTEIVETVSEVVGGQINVGKEIVTSFQYFWLFTIETGTGYAKSFDNSKPVNFFVNIPNQFWKFWEYSVGIDVNINGWGAGINIGGESSFNLHLGKHNIDIFSNSIGRYGFKISSQGDNGEYSYYKFSINMPEVLVTVAVLYFGWQFIAALLLAWGASGAPVPNF
jgi:RHS repeat-associated protein